LGGIYVHNLTTFHEKVAIKQSIHFITIMSSPFCCPYCQKRLKSQRGVTQHINQTPSCLKLQQDQVSAERRAAEAPAHEASQFRRSKRLDTGSNKLLVPPAFASRKFPPDLPDQEPHDNDFIADDDSGASLPKTLPKKRINPEASSTRRSDSSSSESTTNEDTKPAAREPPNQEILEQFRKYCSDHKDNFLKLSKEDITCIKLMDVLRRKAPLHAYESVLQWHLKETGKLREHQSLQDIETYHHRKTLMKNLFPRYNLLGLIPKEKKVRLPSSKAVVSIPVREAADCIVSLLTDPRFEDTDYLFFHDDPLAPPPENLTYLSDLNTGDAYLRTYEKRITNEKQVLLAVPFYIDGAVTGQFTDLPITAVKMSLGIYNREARDCTYAWRELGFIPVVRKDPARGKHIFRATGHLESQDVVVLKGEGDPSGSNDENQEDEGSDPEEDAVKAQDFHTMLSTILESFVKLQRTGFIWDLVYKGKLYKGIEFVIFVPFVKCDTEEADLLCGKYVVRNRYIKHICRYCHCPMDDADNPHAKHPLKTQPAIQKLVANANLKGLQAISQQYIKNAWYDVCFHQANDAGIHGACPSEKLHAIQLGLFKYCRDIFFSLLGKTSELAENINGLATMYGKLFTHQSERDMPYTNFAKGIQKGKLMARDYRGVLLIMAAVLRSQKGRDLLFTKKKMGGKNGLRDWTLLVELLLEWEAFLCEKKMRRADVKRLAKKHRFIMYIMKVVARRSSGMGLKLMKFHAIVHLITDILLYGVPTEFDTASNESHHKDSKHAARLTQRKEATFNFQTAKRLAEFLCIDLAMQEIENDRCVWEYFDGAVEAFMLLGGDELDEISSDGEARPEKSHSSDSQSELSSDEIETGGTRIKIFEDPEQDGKPCFEFLSRSQTMNKGVWMQSVIDWLHELQVLVINYIPDPFLPILTQHKRGNHIFYGHPNFRSSGPWKDWVLIDWGTGWGVLPSHIWCFIGLQNMPIGKDRIEYGGITLTDGVFAVVEVASFVEDLDEATQSDLFVPLQVEVDGIDGDGYVTGRRFYLANTEAFVGPCCVIPDIGGKNYAYFQVKPRREWTNLFVQWLRSPHDDDMEDTNVTENDA
jgi:hypothetical protein